MAGLQEPFGDDLDFFDDGTGFLNDPEAPYWVLGLEIIPSEVEEDILMSFVVSVREGEARTYLVEVKDPAGEPIDLTDQQIKWVVAEVGGAESVIEKNAPAGVEQLFPGMVRLMLASGDTLGLSGVYHQEVKATVGGLPKTIRSGILTVIPSSTGAM
jgi:hypothetical protein